MTLIRRIVIVEDDPHDLELTIAALAQNRLANEVVALRDGVEALDYLYQRGNHALRHGGDPAIVLLDLKLPKIDGLGVLRALKGDERMKHIPIVMLTSSREERDLIESYRLGVNAYVVKPVDFASFIDAVKQIGSFWAVINQVPPGPAAPGTYD
ncbi:MAG: response regulator [Acidobacteria bacterium]|nr:MAG: response regulator [Acidobacteriota bacterium]